MRPLRKMKLYQLKFSMPRCDHLTSLHMKVCVHIRAEVYDWSESQYSRYEPFLKKAKTEIQEAIRTQFGEKWDYPNGTGKGRTTTTGNTVRRILHDENARNIIISTLLLLFGVL